MAILIDVKVSANPALSALTKLDKVLKSINKSVANLNTALGKTANAASNAATQMGSMARQSPAQARTSSATPSSGRSKTPNAFANNPLLGMHAYAQAAASGQSQAVKSFAQYQRLYNAQQRGQKGAQSFLTGGSSNIQSALAKAAGGMGSAGSMIAPILAASGPIGIAIAGITAEIGIFAAALKVSVDSLQSWSHALVMGGGTPGQARAVTRIDAALGVDLAGVGKNLMSGYGPIAAAQAGINPFGGPFGDNDYNAKGLKLFDTVRKQKSFDAARRYAEMAGSPELASAYLLSPDTAKNLRSDNAGQGSYKNMQAAADFSANASIVTDKLKDITIAVIGPILKELAPIMTRFANGLSKINPGVFRVVVDLFNGLFFAIESGIKVIQAGLWAFDQVRDFFKWLTETLARFHVPGFGGDDGTRDLKHSVDRNTKATDDNSRVTKEGTYGGGSRANGAVGSGMSPLAPGWKPGQTSYGVL